MPEYAGKGRAIIEPAIVARYAGFSVPSRVVLCFFGRLLRSLESKGILKKRGILPSGMGEHPFYTFRYKQKTVGVFLPGIGGPMAAAGLEQMIALGATRVIACGGAGVLDSALKVGTVIVPVGAVRDEGTSYHYQKPSEINRPGTKALNAVRTIGRRHSVRYAEGLTWSTDAFYRETPGKIRTRRRQGCLTVEMESAALFAVARFRGIELAHILYAGDDVGGTDWDHRLEVDRKSIHEHLFQLAVESVCYI